MYNNNYQQGGYGNQGYNNPGSNSFNNDFDNEFDIDSINPNAEPWEIAQQLSGGERDIGSSMNLQNAFSQAQNMQVNIDTNKSREMFEQTEVTSRGGGGTSWTTTLISGAAGYAAMSYYQNHQRKQGKQVSYGFMKKMVAGIAMAQAVKMFNKQNSGPGFMGMGGGKRDIEQSRDAVAAEAAANAMKLVDEQYGPGGSQGGSQGANQGGYGGNQGGSYGNNQSYGGNQGGYGGNQSYGGNQPGYGGNQYGSNPPPPAGGYNPSFGTDQKTPYGQPQTSYNSGYNQPPQPQGGFGGPQANTGYGAPQPPQAQGGYGAPQGNYPPSGPNQGQYGQPPSYNNPGPGGFIDPSQKRF